MVDEARTLKDEVDVLRHTSEQVVTILSANMWRLFSLLSHLVILCEKMLLSILLLTAYYFVCHLKYLHIYLLYVEFKRNRHRDDLNRSYLI